MSSQPSLRELRWAMQDCLEAIEEAMRMEGKEVVKEEIESFLREKGGEDAVNAFRIASGDMPSLNGR